MESELKKPRVEAFTAPDFESHKVLREIPVLIFTTSALDSDRQQTLGLGAKYFLTKPASIQGYLDSLTPVIEDILSPCRGHIS